MDTNTRNALIATGVVGGGYILYKSVPALSGDNGMPTLLNPGNPPPWTVYRVDSHAVLAGGDAASQTLLANDAQSRKIYGMQVVLYRMGFTNERATGVLTEESVNAARRFLTAYHMDPNTHGLLNTQTIVKANIVWNQRMAAGGAEIRAYPFPLLYGVLPWA